MLRSLGAVGCSVVLLFAVAACGSSAPPAKASDQPAVADAPEPRNAEWLYATKGFSGGDLQAECDHVQGAIKSEAACVGEACAYASRLTEDWIRRCRNAPPADFEEVSAFARQFNERKKGDRLPCMREIETILTNGCHGQANCAEVAQEWTTRCSGVTNSPLVLRILETRVDQASPRGQRVKLDKRNCKDLASGMIAAANCGQRFQCEDALTSVETYRERCLASGRLPGFQEGLAELSLRLGAGQSVQPIAFDGNKGAFDASTFALPLADSSGIVAMVCGERATDLESYLSLRRECTAGELVVLQKLSSRAKTEVRVGRFEHPSDDTFVRHYPSLIARGEAQARSNAGLERLATELSTIAQRVAAENEYEPALGLALTRALERESSAVRRAEGPTASIKARDSELVPLFRSLARAKVEAVRSVFKPLEYAGFVRRSLRRPLADVDGGGKVSVGGITAAAALDLSKLLPASFAAYQNELATFTDRAKKKPLTATQQSTLSEQLSHASTACASAQGRVRESEGALVECGFGASCEPELVGELRTSLDSARAESLAAYLAVVISSESFDSPTTASKGARCLEPWW